MTMDKDRLAAFADGDLTPEDAAEVVMHLVDHPADQAYVDDLMAANAVLARAFAGPMGEPVPPAIRAAILGAPEAAAGADRVAAPGADRGAVVLPFHRRPAALAGLALAASVAAAAFLLPLGPQAVPAFQPGPLAEGSALWDAVTTLPSGQPVTLATDLDLIILATLPIPQGHCREAEMIDRSAGRLTLALVCDKGQGWAVEVALLEPLTGGTDAFVPAEGDEAAAIGLWLDRLGAGMALGPEAEAKVIAQGWQG